MNVKLTVADVPEEYRTGTEFAYVKDVLHVNWKPHAPTIGPRHVAYAADRCGGILGDGVFDAAGGCAASNGYRQCHMKYAEHTCDTVVLVALRRDTAQDELRAWLLRVNEWSEKHGVDGYTFLEGFKIQ